MKDLVQFKTAFDAELKRFLETKAKEIKREADDKTVVTLFSHTQQIAMHGGKRIRPYIAALMYQACGGKMNKSVWKVLLGIELFHAFALMHDDIIDLGTDRHGTPTLHEFAKTLFKKEKRIGDTTHNAHSQAILVGDMLLVWANECFAESPLPVRNVFAQMNQEVILGQMLDVDGMTRAATTDKAILRKTMMKTAGYTFVQPLRMGWALAGAPKAYASFAESFGRPLGIAFQIQDDLLDLTGTAKELGKQPFSDLRDGQHTLFTQYIVNKGSVKQKTKLKQLLHSTVNEKHAKEVQSLFEESGAFEEVTKTMNGYFKKSAKALVESSFKQKEREPFAALFERILLRRS